MRGEGIPIGPEHLLVLFAWVFAEQIGLPIPAAPALIGAGALAVGRGSSLALVITVGSAASVLADYLWYRGGVYGSDSVSRLLRKHSSSKFAHIAERLIAQFGSRTLVFAKFVPGLSFAAPPLSGASGMRLPRFLAADALGSLIWVGAFAGMGYCFGGEIEACTMARMLVWPCAVSAVVFIGFRSLVNKWRSVRTRRCIGLLQDRFAAARKDNPANLRWLTSLITRDASSDSPAGGVSLRLLYAANPFFAQWMTVWSRKIVIAKALGKVATELKESTRRTVRRGPIHRRRSAASR